MKTEKIYNFRVEIDGLNYKPQFNHVIHGWSNIITNRIEMVDNELIIGDVMIDVSLFNKTIDVNNLDTAIAIINKYKETKNIENIKKEYIYIE